MTDQLISVPTLGQWAKQQRQRKEQKYLIHNILPFDNLVLLSGVPKTAQKTFLAMTAALMVATGKSVGNLHAPLARKVLYIYEEGDSPGTLARFDALSQGHGFGPIDDIENLLFAHREGFMIDDTKAIERMGALVKQLDIKLVIIDTLAKCMRGDENNVQAVSGAIRACNVFRQQECSVMFVHHTRKEDAKLTNGKYGDPEPDYDIRGSSALCGTYETHWAVRTYNSGLDGEQEKFLLVNGKEFPMRAYRYDFKFETEDVEGTYGMDQRLKTCRLYLQAEPSPPYIEPKPARSKKDET